MERNIGAIIITWLLLVMFVLMLNGCKTQDPVVTIGDNAKEQISMAYDHLPKECKSAEREREFNAAINHVTAVVSTCKEQKEALNQRIRYQSALIVVLSLVSIGLFLGIIRTRLV